MKKCTFPPLLAADRPARTFCRRAAAARARAPRPYPVPVSAIAAPALPDHRHTINAGEGLLEVLIQSRLFRVDQNEQSDARKWPRRKGFEGLPW